MRDRGPPIRSHPELSDPELAQRAQFVHHIQRGDLVGLREGRIVKHRVDKVFEDLSYKVDDVRVAFTTPPDAVGGKAVRAKAAPKGKAPAKKGS